MAEFLVVRVIIRPRRLDWISRHVSSEKTRECYRRKVGVASLICRRDSGNCGVFHKPEYNFLGIYITGRMIHSAPLLNKVWEFSRLLHS
jgi:hypothetical protein